MEREKELKQNESRGITDTDGTEKERGNEKSEKNVCTKSVKFKKW